MGDTILAFVSSLPNGTDDMNVILVSFLNSLSSYNSDKCALGSVREGSSRAEWYCTHTMIILASFKHVLIIIFVPVHTYHVHAE